MTSWGFIIFLSLCAIGIGVGYANEDRIIDFEDKIIEKLRKRRDSNEKR